MPFGPTSVAADVGDRCDRQPCRCIPVGLDHRDDYEEGLIMAGESGRFGLRDRPPTPAVRPFDLPPRLKPMLEGHGKAEAGWCR
jgi:hypothetical protein